MVKEGDILFCEPNDWNGRVKQRRQVYFIDGVVVCSAMGEVNVCGELPVQVCTTEGGFKPRRKTFFPLCVPRFFKEEVESKEVFVN